jgi:hypothetical protein
VSNNQSIEIVEVLHRVRSWPQPMRISLARQILQSVEDSTEDGLHISPRGQSAAEVLALLKTNKPAPDDATVRQWIDEHRMEKHGK